MRAPSPLKLPVCSESPESPACEHKFSSASTAHATASSLAKMKVIEDFGTIMHHICLYRSKHDGFDSLKWILPLRLEALPTSTSTSVTSLRGFNRLVVMSCGMSCVAGFWEFQISMTWAEQLRGWKFTCQLFWSVLTKIQFSASFYCCVFQTSMSPQDLLGTRLDLLPMVVALRLEMDTLRFSSAELLFFFSTVAKFMPEIPQDAPFFLKVPVTATVAAFIAPAAGGWKSCHGDGKLWESTEDS